MLLIAVGFTGRAEAQGSPTNDILQLVNQVRAEYGLPSLSYNAALAAAAQNHAGFIAANAIYSHIGVNGSTWQDRAQAAGYTGYAGENLVGGTRLTPQQGVIWWRNSAVHFSNMLNPRWTEAGVGYAVGNGQNFYVMVFGTPNDAPPPRGEQPVVDVPFIVAPIELAQPNEDGSIIHTVLEGHTLWAIAARYEVSLADLYLFNGLNEESVINPGDKLTIRLADGQAPPPPPPPHPHPARLPRRPRGRIAMGHRRLLQNRFGNLVVAQRSARRRCRPPRQRSQGAAGARRSPAAHAHAAADPHRQKRRHSLGHRSFLRPDAR